MKFIILLLISIVIYVNGYSHNNVPKKYNEKIKNGIRNAVALTSFSLILNPKAMAAVLSDEERQQLMAEVGKITETMNTPIEIKK